MTILDSYASDAIYETPKSVTAYNIGYDVCPAGSLTCSIDSVRPSVSILSSVGNNNQYLLPGYGEVSYTNLAQAQTT